MSEEQDGELFQTELSNPKINSSEVAPLPGENPKSESNKENMASEKSKKSQRSSKSVKSSEVSGEDFGTSTVKESDKDKQESETKSQSRKQSSAHDSSKRISSQHTSERQESDKQEKIQSDKSSSHHTPAKITISSKHTTPKASNHQSLSDQQKSPTKSPFESPKLPDSPLSSATFQSGSRKTTPLMQTPVLSPSSSNSSLKESDNEYYHSAQAGNRSKSQMSRRHGKKQQKTFYQEYNAIPKGIRTNPYVQKRMGIYTCPKKDCIPRAALPPSVYNERAIPEFDPYTEAVLNGEEVEEDPTIEQLKRSSNQLRLYEKDLITKSNYVEAWKADVALETVNNNLAQTSHFQKSKGSIEQLISKRNELCALVEQLSKEWDEMIEQHDQATEKKIQDMMQKHQEEREDLEASIPEELPALFKRNSVTYHKYRSKEKYLALNKDFVGAINLQKKADILQKQEEEANFAKLDKHFRDKKKKMRQRHAKSLQTYQSYAEMRRNELLTSKAVQIRGAQNRIISLEKQIKKQCERTGVKRRQLNLDIFDEERMARVKEAEDSNPVSRKRAATSFNQSRSGKRNPQITTPRTNTQKSTAYNSLHNTPIHSTKDLPDASNEIEDDNQPQKPSNDEKPLEDDNLAQQSEEEKPPEQEGEPQNFGILGIFTNALAEALI